MSQLWILESQGKIYESAYSKLTIAIVVVPYRAIIGITANTSRSLDQGQDQMNENS